MGYEPFIYVEKQHKDKMLALGYELIKSDSGGKFFIFKNKNKDDAKFSLGELERSGVQYMGSSVLTF